MEWRGGTSRGADGFEDMKGAVLSKAAAFVELFHFLHFLYSGTVDGKAHRETCSKRYN